MVIRPTSIPGAFVLEPEPLEDDRGFLARAWCRETLADAGLETEISQANIAFNTQAGTLRGLHFQRDPHAEVKIVRCTAGALYDVIVDLRPSSPTYLGWLGIELSAANRLALYVPRGFAHGYQTLTGATEAFYLHSASHAPDSAGGVRWNDPTFGIDWPGVEQRTMSERDRSWPDYDPAEPVF